MQLARVIRLSVNKSYQFIILEVRDTTRARAAVFTLLTVYIYIYMHRATTQSRAPAHKLLHIRTRYCTQSAAAHVARVGL